MNILGIHGDYFNRNRKVFESNASIIRDGKIISAISEERVSRIKMDGSYPYKAIEENLRVNGLEPEDLDYVVFATRRPFQDGVSYLRSMISTFQDTSVLPVNTNKFKLHGLGILNRFFKRNSKTPSLNGDVISKFDFQYVDHHYGHAAGAYYGSPFKDALVITLDGGGNGLDGGAYIARNKMIRRLLEIPHFQSPGDNVQRHYK